MMPSLADINARLASITTGITHLQMDVGKIYTYLKMLAMHTIFPLPLPSSTQRSVVIYKKKRMANTLIWLYQMI